MLRKIINILAQPQKSAEILENKEMMAQLTSDQLELLEHAITKNELLPILQLAYTFERNGDPEEHAKKLLTLFDTTTKALQYLIDFAKKTPQ